MYNRVLKRSFDLFVAIILIPALLILIPLLALLIKFDSRGPVFFVQKRNRKGGKIFSCIKFRTMIVNDEADSLAARPGDQRITRLGKILRHYHIDELPQLFNVLIGDMSVVGPRPYMLKENAYYETLLNGYAFRHSIKPGITGLAQSFGLYGAVHHDVEKIKERVDLDILYIKQWSVIMDIKIILRTFGMIAGIEIRKTNNELAAVLKTS